MAVHASSERPSRAFKETTRYKRTVRALGLRVRTLREERSWTLQEAADVMLLDLKHLQKIESGQLNVTLVTLTRIADGFGEPLGALFWVPERKKRPR